MLETLDKEWSEYCAEERISFFRSMPRKESEDIFTSLSSFEQAELLMMLPDIEKRSWLKGLEPDDIADVIQHTPGDDAQHLLDLLDDVNRKEVVALMAYAEDEAGGLMSPRFARLRPEMTIDEALRYLRKQAPDVETLQYAYVLDSQQQLLGVLSLRKLFASNPNQIIKDIMTTDLITVPEEMNQDEVGHLLSQHDLAALPVVDKAGPLRGIVTFDDIADVVSESVTEDIQKMGAVEALEYPYLKTKFFKMVQKRVGWLSVLFIGEMFTATAIGYFEESISRAVVLALFIPLIISSGGNSGSQASTLVIRAMALGEVKMRDWWTIFRRELGAGLVIGSLLGFLGFCRIITWHLVAGIYGEHYFLIGVTVGISLVGVVCWGTLSGSMLPFILKRIGFDPASASTPFVATMVDVTGIVIYFSTASLLLSGTLL